MKKTFIILASHGVKNKGFPFMKNNKSKRNKNQTCEHSLSSFSEYDNHWDQKKHHNFIFQNIFLNSPHQFQKKWAEPMATCAEHLWFLPFVDLATGLFKIKLNTAYFCKKRHCPVCDWRRSLMKQAMIKNKLPKLIAENPKARFILVTFTITNPPISELRETLKIMNNAFKNLMKRDRLKAIKGFIKKVEVTVGKQGADYCHPHFHCLFQVNESYFTNKTYIPHEEWLDLWASVLKTEPEKVGVDIRAMRKKFDENDHAITEVLKAMNYSVKPEDFTKNISPDWLREFAKQIYGMKFLTSGGTLKNFFKDEKDDDDLVHVDEENQDDGLIQLGENPIKFTYVKNRKMYFKSN